MKEYYCKKCNGLLTVTFSKDETPKGKCPKCKETYANLDKEVENHMTGTIYGTVQIVAKDSKRITGRENTVQTDMDCSSTNANDVDGLSGGNTHSRTGNMLLLWRMKSYSGNVNTSGVS